MRKNVRFISSAIPAPHELEISVSCYMAWPHATNRVDSRNMYRALEYLFSFSPYIILQSGILTQVHQSSLRIRHSTACPPYLTNRYRVVGVRGSDFLTRSCGCVHSVFQLGR